MHWSMHHFYNLSIETSGTKLIWPYLLVEWARSNSCILHITTNIPLVTNWDRIRFPFPFTIHHSHTVRSGEPSTLEPTPHRKQSLLLGFPRMARIAPLRRDRGARAAAGAFTTAAQGSRTNASNHQARGIDAAGWRWNETLSVRNGRRRAARTRAAGARGLATREGGGEEGG